MQFHELEAFITLAENLNFARTAEEVHLSSSALSRLIQRLEDEMEVSLLVRDTRKVELTEEGLEFLDFAKDVTHKKNDLGLRLEKKDEKLHGILRIYASVTACYSILPSLVETLSKEHPALRLSVETGDPSDAYMAVRDGRAELAVDALPDSGFPGMEYFSLTKSPLVFIALKGGKYENILQDCFKPEVLFARYPVILPKSGLARQRFDYWIHSKKITPIVAAETVGNEAVFALARLDLGIGLVPRIVLENSPFSNGLCYYDAGHFLGHYDIGFVLKPQESKKHLYKTLSEIIKRIY
jgi:LysR family positive regulator for ilvC